MTEEIDGFVGHLGQLYIEAIIPALHIYIALIAAAIPISLLMHVFKQKKERRELSSQTKITICAVVVIYIISAVFLSIKYF